MPYITKQQLINRFSNTEIEQLTDRDNLGTIDDDVLNGAINDASNVVDSYIKQVKTLPLTQTVIDASPLPRYCGDIVRYFLNDNRAGEEVETRYKAAMAWLRDLVNGKASLGEQDTQVASGGRIKTGQGKSNTDWGSY